MVDTLTKKHVIPLEAFLDEPTFILRGVYSKRAYVNNVATDDICGYTYECFNTKTFELIRVTVSQSKPLVTSDEIADSLENGTPIVVEFDDAMVKVYMPRDAKTFAESITAKAITIVKQD